MRILRTFILFLLAMAGVATALINAQIPQDLMDATGMDRQTLLLVSAANNALIVGVAVLIGAFTAHRVGLISLIAHKVDDAGKRMARMPVWLVTGLALGAAVAVSDHWAFANIPALKEFAALNINNIENTAPTLAMRFLYGGLTEEVLLRWGVLSFFAWLLWILIRNKGVAITIAIVIAALLFGAGHLPGLFKQFDAVPTEMIVRVVFLNAALGLAYGTAYARNSLEAGMLAHASTHAGMLLTAMALGL